MILHFIEQNIDKYKYFNFAQNYFRIFTIRFEQDVFSIQIPSYTTHLCTYRVRQLLYRHVNIEQS